MPIHAALARRFVAVTLAVLPLLLLGACADMSKDDCLKADWRAIGQQDALKGRTTERFEQRGEACRKNEVGADREAYLAGHAQGRLAYCTAERGKTDALAGQPAAAVCAGPDGQAYGVGHTEGLQKFCTPRNGFDLGRFGMAERNLCPEELASGFRIGYRLGREIYTLNERLSDIQRMADDERKTLSDPKSTPDRRDAANRRLGQLDGDESSVRAMIRQAEQSGLAFSTPGSTVTVVTAATAAQWLPGRWQVASVRFKMPVDLNGDGVKSPDAMAEYDRCGRDQQLDLDADYRAALSTGASTPNCTPRTKAYQWRVTPANVRTATQENGRRVVAERAVVTLQLKGGADPVSMVIEKVDASTLVTRTEMYDGTDTSSEAVVTYTRRR